jgi:catalase
MAGNEMLRSYRYRDAFGVHASRFLMDNGKLKFAKWDWKPQQGKASLVWEEAQVLAWKNANFYR